MKDLKFASNRNQLAPFCPCGKSNRDGKFAPSKENPNEGYCHSCSKLFQGNETDHQLTEKEPEKPTQYHDLSLLRKSLKVENLLSKFLKTVFNSGEVDQVLKKYKVGYSNHWKGSTIFWQVDNLERVRYGKIMLYDQITGKRVKEPFNHFTNVHSVLKLKDFSYKQCLFGLHLLPYNKKPIAIVESEKTALIMSIVDNSFLWLATGGKGNFNYEFLKPLKGKQITAFPDAGETVWEDVSDRLNDIGFNITISSVLEGKQKGYDLADAVLNEIDEKKVKKCKKYSDYSKDERIKFGLSYFTDDQLKEFGKQLFSNCKHLLPQPMYDAVQVMEGLEQNDTEDIIDIMVLKNIITVTDSGYKLT